MSMIADCYLRRQLARKIQGDELATDENNICSYSSYSVEDTITSAINRFPPGGDLNNNSCLENFHPP